MKYFDRNTWFWIAVSGLFFLPFLGGVHLFDWDEINFAEIAREMVVTGDFLQPQINYQSFTEKPPFFFWLQALSMLVWGVGDYAARFPNALLGMLVIPVLYISGKFLVDRKFGFLWALSWFGSILPALYFKSGIIDPWFNFFIFNGLFMLIHFLWKKKDYKNLYFSKSAHAYLLLAAVSTGLGILTKGPVAFLIIFLCLAVYFVLERFKLFISIKHFVLFCTYTLLVTFLWFGIDAVFNGPDFFIEFTIRQWELLTTSDAGHGGFFGYHFVVLLLGCFPASIWAIQGFGKFIEMPYHLRNFQRWMLILLGVILVLFSLVGTKIVHYSSMAYYPISFLSALALYNLIKGRAKRQSIVFGATLLMLFILALVSVALPYIGQHPDLLAKLVEKDAFASANIKGNAIWSIFTYIPAVWVILVAFAFALLWKKRKDVSIKVLFFGNAIWVFLVLIFFIGKIEGISQRASVAFFESKVGQEVYVTTYQYKSYVPWYYAKVMPYSHPKAQNQEWLLYGQTDRPVFISCKITAHQKLEADLLDAQFLYKKNGFYFYRRN